LVQARTENLSKFEISRKLLSLFLMATPTKLDSNDHVIRMAWHDRTSFDRIEEQTGLNEAAVIRIMRRELKPRSFRLWRERVTGRVTKHRKLFKRQTGDPRYGVN